MSQQRSHQQRTVLKKLELVYQYRLVLIVAPSGTGKTTYLQRWIQERFACSPIPPLWFDITEEDDQPNRFINILFSGLAAWNHRILDHIDLSGIDVQTQQVQAMSDIKPSPNLSPTIEANLMEIINAFIHLEGDRFIILENYHLIHDAEIHGMIAYLIDYLPPNFHLIITSQVTPPLQVPRLRVRRELLEIGSEDLH